MNISVTRRLHRFGLRLWFMSLDHSFGSCLETERRRWFRKERIQMKSSQRDASHFKAELFHLKEKKIYTGELLRALRSSPLNSKKVRNYSESTHCLLEQGRESQQAILLILIKKNRTILLSKQRRVTCGVRKTGGRLICVAQCRMHHVASRDSLSLWLFSVFYTNFFIELLNKKFLRGASRSSTISEVVLLKRFFREDPLWL